MDFYAILDQVIDLLKQRGRVSYRALKVQFHLDDEALEALKDELIEVHGCRSHIDVGTLRHAAPDCPVLCVSLLTGHRHSGIRVFSHAPPTPEGSPHASIAEPCLLV